MDRGQQLIGICSQGTGTEAVIVQPATKPVDKVQLIGHYSGGKSNEC